MLTLTLPNPEPQQESVIHRLIHLLCYEPFIEPIYYPLQSNSHLSTLSIPHIMTSSIELTALPSLTSNLSDLPRMQNIDPNLLHILPFSHSGAASRAKLKAALKHTHSTPKPDIAYPLQSSLIAQQ